MSDWWLEIAKVALAPSVAIAVIGWVVRAAVQQGLSKDLERHRGDLEKDAITHRVRYEKLHTRRAEAIEELYKRISRAETAFNRFMHPFQAAGDLPEEEKGKIASEAANLMQDYYYENRIYFEEDLAADIDELMNEFKKAWRKFDLSRTLRQMDKANMKEWDEAWKQVSELIPERKRRLEQKFREILGIES